MIINNKQYILKENIENIKRTFKIKIKFIDNIINPLSYQSRKDNNWKLFIMVNMRA